MRCYIFTEHERRVLELYFQGILVDGFRQIKKNIREAQKQIEKDYALFQKSLYFFEK